MSTKYIIITPVRDEEKFVESTIQCLLQQTVLPAEWILVDDGSVDRTGTIIDQYASQNPWIHAVHRVNRGFRFSGAGVMQAFYEGHKTSVCPDWEYLVKLDGDLSIPPDYFEKCFDRFRRDPKLGIGGGALYHVINGQFQLEENPHFHVRGATKIYRRACWEDIGGLQTTPGWDTIDEVKANMMGWQTQTFSDIHVTHHRFTGTGDTTWRESVKSGRGGYASGYHPAYFLARCAYHLGRKLELVGVIGMLWGFVSGYLLRAPRVEDKKLLSYIRQQQIARLFGRQTIWR
jgi:poly-beta-1,6-N-acetyl-D-glucosamine synthase